MQEAQAEANKSIAQAQAEIRRAAAVALEQEMKAKVQEMQAKVASSPDVELRIEIEKRLRALAERAGIPEERSMIRLFNRLRDAGVLRDASLSGLQELVNAGNRAAHGAAVEPDVASWAREYGPQIIAALDARLRELESAG